MCRRGLITWIGDPKPEHRVLYICDTHVTATSVCRNLAHELGLHPAHRRDALWRDLKRTLLQLVDEQGVIPSSSSTKHSTSPTTSSSSTLPVS